MLCVIQLYVECPFSYRTKSLPCGVTNYGYNLMYRRCAARVCHGEVGTQVTAKLINSADTAQYAVRAEVRKPVQYAQSTLVLRTATGRNLQS